MSRYYSSLPRELILRFYDAFRMDFDMFDYSINDILLKAGYETIEDVTGWLTQVQFGKPSRDFLFSPVLFFVSYFLFDLLCPSA